MAGVRTVERSRLAVSPSALLDLLDDVEVSHAAYQVTRYGRPVAVIVSLAEYGELRAALSRLSRLSR